MNEIHKFLALDPYRRRLLFRAIINLSWSRWMVSRKPLKTLLSSTMQDDHPAAEPTASALTLEEKRHARAVGWAIRTASSRIFPNYSCLVQVLAARRMLKSDGVSGTLFIGALRSEELSVADGLEAHAWLVCKGEFVTGESGHEKYTVISSERW